MKIFIARQARKVLTPNSVNEIFRFVKQDQLLPESAKQTKAQIQLYEIFRQTCNAMCVEPKASVDMREAAIQELRRCEQRLAALDRHLQRFRTHGVKVYTGKQVHDEFTDLKVSRQRKQQLRKGKHGYCIEGGCWRRSLDGHQQCATHRLKQLRKTSNGKRVFFRRNKKRQSA